MNKLCRALCNSVLLCAVLIDITNACRGGTIMRKYLFTFISINLLRSASSQLPRYRETLNWSDK